MAVEKRSEMVYATRKVHVLGGASLLARRWTAEEMPRLRNLTVAHGHNYVLEVTSADRWTRERGWSWIWASSSGWSARRDRALDHATSTTTRSSPRGASPPPRTWGATGPARPKLGPEDCTGSACGKTPPFHVGTSADGRPAADALLSLQRRPPAREHGPRRGGERAHLRPCYRQHGHNYLLEVTVRELDPVTGMSADLAAWTRPWSRGAEPRDHYDLSAPSPSSPRDHDGRRSRPDLLEWLERALPPDSSAGGGGPRPRTTCSSTAVTTGRASVTSTDDDSRRSSG